MTKAEKVLEKVRRDDFDGNFENVLYTKLVFEESAVDCSTPKAVDTIEKALNKILKGKRFKIPGGEAVFDYVEETSHPSSFG